MVYEIIPIQLCNSVIPESYRLYQTTNHGGHTKNTAQLIEEFLPSLGTDVRREFPTSSPLQPPTLGIEIFYMSHEKKNSDTSHETAWLFL